MKSRIGILFTAVIAIQLATSFVNSSAANDRPSAMAESSAFLPHRGRRVIALSDRFVMLVTTPATARERAGVGLRSDAPVFPGEKGSAGWRPRSGLISPISARSNGFAPDIMAPYTYYPLGAPIFWHESLLPGVSRADHGSGEATNQFPDLLVLKGLGQAFIGHTIQVGIGRGCKGTTGNKHDPVGEIGKAAVQLRVKVHPGHRRHHQIAKDDVEPVAVVEQRQGIAGVGDGRDIVALENFPENGTDGRLIIDDEHPCAGHGNTGQARRRS